MTWAIGWNGAGTRPVFYLNTIKIKPIRLSMCNKSCVEHIKPRFNWWSLLIFSLSGWHDRQSTELYFVESHVQYNFTAWQWTFYVPKMSISVPRCDVKTLWSIILHFMKIVTFQNHPRHPAPPSTLVLSAIPKCFISGAHLHNQILNWIQIICV